VAFKWFVEEPGSAEARRLAEDYSKRLVDIASVELLPFEVLNALRYAPDTGLEDLRAAAQALGKLNLDLYPLVDELAERCLENALRVGVSVYDSAYLSLGELLEAPMFTADSWLMGRVGGSVLRHISDYGH